MKQEIIFFVNWRRGKKPTFDGGDEMNTDSFVEKYAIQNIVRGPMVINLLSQFFFMMSHYIIEPSSAKVRIKFVAVRLRPSHASHVYSFLTSTLISLSTSL